MAVDEDELKRRGPGQKRRQRIVKPGPHQAIAMIATARPEPPLERAIDNLRHGGFDEMLHAFAEPGLSRPRRAALCWHPNPTRLGVVANWSLALRWLVNKTPAPNLLLVEEDGDYWRGARDMLAGEIARTPDYGLVSLYLAARFAHRHAGASGWRSHTYDERTFGAVAVCFRRGGGVEDFLASPELERLAVAPETASHDELLFRYFRQHGHSCRTHRPSLADHIGFASTLGHQDGSHRRGLDFDRDMAAPAPRAPAERAT